MNILNIGTEERPFSAFQVPTKIHTVSAEAETICIPKIGTVVDLKRCGRMSVSSSLSCSEDDETEDEEVKRSCKDCPAEYYSSDETQVDSDNDSDDDDDDSSSSFGPGETECGFPLRLITKRMVRQAQDIKRPRPLTQARLSQLAISSSSDLSSTAGESCSERADGEESARSLQSRCTEGSDGDSDDEIVSSLETWMGDNLPQVLHHDVHETNYSTGQQAIHDTGNWSVHESENEDDDMNDVSKDRPTKRQRLTEPTVPTESKSPSPAEPTTAPASLAPCVSEADEEELAVRQNSEKLEAQIASREVETPPSLPAALLTPPSSPMSLPGDDDSTTVQESKINLILDARLTAKCLLRPLSPSFVERLQEDDENYAFTCLEPTLSAPAALAPLLGGM